MGDLTHVFATGMPTYGNEKPTRQNHRSAAPAGEFGFYNNRWTFTEHVGTHMDAPGHVIGGGRLAPDNDTADLIAPAVVIDIRRKAAANPTRSSPCRTSGRSSGDTGASLAARWC